MANFNMNMEEDKCNEEEFLGVDDSGQRNQLLEELNETSDEEETSANDSNHRSTPCWMKSMMQCGWNATRMPPVRSRSGTRNNTSMTLFHLSRRHFPPCHSDSRYPPYATFRMITHRMSLSQQRYACIYPGRASF